LNRGRHLCSAGRPSRWALAHILVFASVLSNSEHGVDNGCDCKLGVDFSADLHGFVPHADMLSEHTRPPVSDRGVRSRTVLLATDFVRLQRVHDPVLVSALRSRLHDALQTAITLPKLLSQYVISYNPFMAFTRATLC